MQLHNEESLKKAESDLKMVARMLDEYIRSASISEGDMADGRYAELESRLLMQKERRKRTGIKKNLERVCIKLQLQISYRTFISIQVVIKQ